MILKPRNMNRVIASIAVALLTGPSAAQEAKPADAPSECGTRVTPEEAADILQLQALGMYDGGAQPRYLLYVALTIHIVRPTNGIGGTTQANIDATIDDANAHWIGAGLQFYQSGPTLFVDHDTYYFNIDTQAELDALRGTDQVGNTVNTYFTLNLAVEDGPDPDNLPDSLCGQATFTSTPGSQGVVMNNSCTNAGGNTSTFAHELGHYFDLLHTHVTTFGMECPNGSNCSNTGDLLCDTAADPDLTGNLNGCTYNGTATRCGTAFNPDPTNLMSYGGSCRTHFTIGQLNRALGTLVNLRSNLVASPGLNVTWVDFAFGGGSNGSFNQPYNNLATAVNAVATGGRIVIKAGSAYQTLTINKALTVDSFRGTATVGQ
jgi:hypothetical protein